MISAARSSAIGRAFLILISIALGILVYVAWAFARPAPPSLMRPAAQTPQSGAAAPRKQVVPIAIVRGQYCTMYAPRGWYVVAENAQRIAFGADFTSSDRHLVASYSVFGGGPSRVRVGGQATPDQAVAHALMSGPAGAVQFGRKTQMSQNLWAIEYGNQQTRGIAFWEVFPSPNGDFVILMRDGHTHPSEWLARSGEAIGVARSLTCRLPNIPPEPIPPALLNPSKSSSGSASSGDAEKKDDTEYNPILDMEYYHDEAGNNYWVSPSHDWNKQGPEGDGYYANPYQDKLEKLQPGYAPQ